MAGLIESRFTLHVTHQEKAFVWKDSVNASQPPEAQLYRGDYIMDTLFSVPNAANQGE